MAEELLSEAVRKYPVLYDKTDRFFKDRNKKAMAWEDVAQEAHFENGKSAEVAFRNLRNKYGRERRKLKACMRSGAGTGDVDVRLSEMFPFLGWLEPHFLERETATNYYPNHQEEEEVQEEEDEINDSVSVASTPSDISLITGRAQCKKRARKAVESDTTADEKRLMQQLQKRLSAPSTTKDEDALYGELMAANLRKLSSDNKLMAKHEIDNIMFRYLYAQRQQEKVVQQVPAPTTPTHAESPSHAIYQQSGLNIQGSPIRPQESMADGSPVFNQQYTQLMRQGNPYVARGNLFAQFRVGNNQ